MNIDQVNRRLEHLRRIANTRRGAVKAAFDQYRACIDQRRRIESEIASLTSVGRRLNQDEQSELDAVKGALSTATHEFQQADADYNLAQEAASTAGSLVLRCEEWLDETTSSERGAAFSDQHDIFLDEQDDEHELG